MSIKLIAGLGNPGPKYQSTRHNAGAWWVQGLAARANVNFKEAQKLHCHIARYQQDGLDFHLILPTTFMNLSGQAVLAACQFYKIAPEEVLIAHDELDIAPGEIRYKQDGGHGGHNGLRDIMNRLGGRRDFYRLRIGIGHPGDKNKVSGYVLNAPTKDEYNQIESALDTADRHLAEIISGDLEGVQNILHAK